MNKRIEDLIKQCTYTITEYSEGIDHSVEVFDKELFATMLVCQCAKVALDSSRFNDRPAGVTIEDVVRNHFGIK